MTLLTPRALLLTFFRSVLKKMPLFVILVGIQMRAVRRYGAEMKKTRESVASRIVMLVFLAAVLVLSLSPRMGKNTGADSKTGAFSSKKIVLSAGTFEPDCETLTAVLNSGETALLDGFTGLRSADLRGSGCYREIADWAAAHPETAVRYSVELPNGKRLDNDATEADLSGLADGDFAEAADMLSCLPKLSSVRLGLCGGEGLSAENFAALFEMFPDTAFDYSFMLDGREIEWSASELDVSDVSPEAALAAAPFFLPMKNIQYVNMGAEGGNYDLATVKAVQDALPEADVEYHFSLFGKEFSTLDESMDFWYVPMDDGGAAVRSVLPCMKKCTYVDMDSCGISNEDMAALQADFPNMKIVWRVWFADMYSVRTDAIKILASKPSVGGTIFDDDAAVLKYCTDIKYLDLGHNVEITDISFVSYMPKLEVFIIAMNHVSDLSPLANCYNLEYLEIQTTDVTDLSPLAGLTELRHLNIGELPDLYDISPLYGLTELERLWITATTPIPAEQVEVMRGCAPGCDINTTAGEPHGEKWRFYKYDPDIPRYWWVERHELLREQMGYNGQWYSFYWTDPKCQKPCPSQYIGMYGVDA